MTQITKVLEDGQGDVLKNVVGVRAADQGQEDEYVPGRNVAGPSNWTRMSTSLSGLVAGSEPRGESEHTMRSTVS